MRPIYKRTWFKFLAGLVILLLLVISFLPYGVQYGIERWYLQQGADEVRINDVDINLFTGELSIHEFKALQSEETLMQFDSAGLELEWLPLFKKRALVTKVHVNGLQTTITQQQNGQIKVAGILPDDTKNQSTDWGLGIQGISVNDTILTLITPQQQFKIGINAIALDRIESWSEDQSHIKFTGEINNSPIVLDGQFNAFAKHPVFEGILSLKSMDLDQISIYVKDKIHTLRGKVDLNSEFRLAKTDAQHFNFKSDASLSLKKLSLANASIHLDSDLIALNGNLDVSWDQQLVITQLAYIGNMATENTSGNYLDNYHYQNDRFEWQGSIKSEGQHAPYTLTGHVSAKGIKVDDRVSAIELVKAEQFIIRELTASSDSSLQASDLEINNVSLLLSSSPADQIPLFQAKKLTINHSKYDKTKLAIDNVTIQQALIDVDRQKDGRIKQLALLEKKSTGDKKVTDSPSTKPTNSPSIQVTEVSLSSNSIIRFKDTSVDPVFKTEIDVQLATLKQLDSSQPSSQSPIRIKAKLDKYSSIAIDGTIKPFTKPMDINLQTILNDIALPPLSSYSANTIGYDMVSGQLNANSKIEIKNGKIDGTNKLTINNLEIKPGDTQKSEKLNSELSMPLDSALSLLRNKDNDIKLSLPVTGDINNPDFDISGVINKALGNALKKSSLAYLTLALQPYGSLIAIASLAKDAANKVSLNPIEFTSGSSALNQTARDYIKKLSSVLTDRPQLRLKLCGYSTPSDKTALDSASKTGGTPSKDILTLANDRAETIKSTLVTTYQVDPSRLFVCKPQVDKETESKPRVEITL